MSVYQKDISRIFKHLLLQYETQITLQKKGDRKLDRFSIMEISIMEYLMSHRSVTQNELIELLDIKRGKAIGILKRMLEAGYIKKTTNDLDKRQAFIHLDTLGDILMAEYAAHESEFLEFVLKDMTINEEKAIVKFLSKINQTDYMK